MSRLPEYVGPAAFGIKMGVIVPGMDLVTEIAARVKQCVEDGLVDDYDVLCITESVVARAQNNIVTIDQVVAEITKKLQITPTSKLGVVFPIISRNRFSLILKAIARAVPQGKVVVQLSFPTDEVGNQVIPEDVLEALGKTYYDVITEADIAGKTLVHPVTKIDYVQLYREVITNEGAQAEIFLANDPKAIIAYDCDAVIIADIHTREKTFAALKGEMSKVITLVDICSNRENVAWSEWGLLGSNMSAGEKLKLAPRNSDEFAMAVQARVKEITDKNVEVIVYGDGAYKDPSTGIYELADPRPVFGSTPGFKGVLREGIKYKFLADLGYSQGKTPAEIEQELNKLKKAAYNQDDLYIEGTTPRPLADVIASLADLVSGSADAGTPLIVVKGFISPE